MSFGQNNNLGAPGRDEIIIAIVSCRKNARLRDGIRQTWLKNCPYRYNFYIGGERPSDAKDDEVYLDCPDTYEALCAKTLCIIKYLSKTDFKYLLKCDDDSYLFFEELAKIDFSGKDYLGRQAKYFYRGYFFDKVAPEYRKPLADEKDNPFGVGMGHFLSKRAANIVLAHGATKWDGVMRLEDEYVGDILFENGVPLSPIKNVGLDDLERIYNPLYKKEKNISYAIMHHCDVNDMKLLMRRRYLILRFKHIVKILLGIILPRVIGQIKRPHIPVKIAQFINKHKTHG